MPDDKNGKKTVTANDAMAIRHLEKSLATQHLNNGLKPAAKPEKKESSKIEAKVSTEKVADKS